MEDNPLTTMFSGLIGKIILGQVRHLVLAFGIWMEKSDLWTSDQSHKAEDAIMILVPLALSAWDKYKQEAAKNAAIVAAAEKETVK